MAEELWTDDRVMARYRAFIETNGAEYANIAWQSVMIEMVEEYEAELARLREKLPGPEDESNADRYYRGFNDGVEFAQKRVEVDDEISPAALQAAGWEYRGETHEEYERWLSDDASIPYVEVGHDMSVAIYYEEESSACIRVPGCTTMSQLAALVNLLTPAE